MLSRYVFASEICYSYTYSYQDNGEYDRCWLYCSTDYVIVYDKADYHNASYYE